MNFINYNEIESKIYKNDKTRVKIDSIILNDSEKEKILKNIFKNENFDNIKINNMNITYTENYYLLVYDTFNYKNNVINKNICICRDNDPIIKISHYKKEINNQVFIKDCYYSYLENGKIDSSIKINKIINKESNLENYYVSLLNYKNNEYNKMNYILYYDKDICNTIICDDEILLNKENGFINKYNIIRKETNNCSNKFLNSLDSVLGIDNVKKYSIKRKIK